MKTLFIGTAMLLVGIVSGWLLRGYNQNEQVASYHWKKVEEYRDSLKNPANYEKNGDYLEANEVPDISPNLAALVAMGELKRREVIIPDLPNEGEHILSWITFCQRPGIIDATGPGGYQKGEIPLMFTVWYKDEAEEALLSFIEELRRKGAQIKSETEPNNSDNSSSERSIQTNSKAQMKIGDSVPEDMLYKDPPDSSVSTQNLFFGLKEGDLRHKLYAVPKITPIGQIVRDFKVGKHGAESNSWDTEETIRLLAEKAEAIAAVIPCRVIFADQAGLKLRFLRQITPNEIAQIEALFPENEMMQAGLDGYISDWDGESSLLSSIAEENLIPLWWD